MPAITPSRIAPELKQIVAEASRALAYLDAERLEELAGCCQALNRNLPPRGELARQALDARAEMTIFAHVLEATRANLKVMRRLRELRQGLAEYGGSNGISGWKGDADGDH
ncbi:MAG TPA: hypothetical protein VMU71_03300 [Terracidiphilus sp.]|jgi:hypothetical protein|nr:hypothetical protein [Terracidiphilus sp.]